MGMRRGPRTRFLILAKPRNFRATEALRAEIALLVFEMITKSRRHNRMQSSIIVEEDRLAVALHHDIPIQQVRRAPFAGGRGNESRTALSRNKVKDRIIPIARFIRKIDAGMQRLQQTA